MKLFSILKANEAQARRLILKDLKANGYKPTVTEDFIYAEGTVPVLLVAHYDTVLDTPPRFIAQKDGVLSGQNGLGADDRAGVYAICEIIKNHHCHVLFTGGEERGCVGADAFTRSGITPKVNYIIELDRRGENDAVYYEGDNDEFEAFITEHGWKTACGTFTDIRELAPYIGTAAVNLSIGYQNEHKPNETLDTRVLNENIKRVQLLLDGGFFEWKERPFTAWSRYNLWDDDTYIIYYSANGEEVIESKISYALSEEEAVGLFLMCHPTLCFNDVLEVTRLGCMSTFAPLAVKGEVI